MKKKLLLLFCFISFSLTKAQVVITEVYYDTPYLEDIYLYTNLGLLNPNPYYYNLGEYIELYNYSTEDIPLKGWMIGDKVSKYQFPDNAIIHSGEFIVVVYRPKNNNIPFTTYFPTTLGKELQIYYQDKMFLNNKSEELRLMVGFIRGIDCKKKVIQRMSWNNGFDVFNDGNLDNTYNSTDILDYYSISSLHLAEISTPSIFSLNTPTPLESQYIPPMQDLKDIAVAQEALIDAIFDNTWEPYSSSILNNICDDNIPIIEQTPSETYLLNGKCFTYEGDNISSENCNPTPIIPTPSTTYSQEQLAEFSDGIAIAPNPTYTTTTAYLTGNIVGKVTNIQVTGFNGCSALNTNIVSTQTTIIINLNGLAAQLYVANFTLNTGQLIAKYIIKI